MFSGEYDEQEPCDGCSKIPSVHMGHGSYSCESCFKARFCEKCNYSKGFTGEHVCPSPEEHERRKAEFNFVFRDQTGDETLIDACMRLRSELLAETRRADDLQAKLAMYEACTAITFGRRGAYAEQVAADEDPVFGHWATYVGNAPDADGLTREAAIARAFDLSKGAK